MEEYVKEECQDNKDHQDGKERKEHSTLWKKVIIFVLMLLFFLFFMMNALAPGNLSPDYAPRQTEQNAKDLPEDTDTEKMPAEEGGGAVSITYSMDVFVRLCDDNAKLYFANPSKSNSDMTIEIVVQQEVIAKSGLIMTGKEVEQLSLVDGMADRLSPGGYEGKIVVSFYHPETGEKENVTTEIPVTVEVS